MHDLNSTNGTFINGQQVTGEAVVKSGQILRLGQVEMRLEDAEPKAAAAPKNCPIRPWSSPRASNSARNPPPKSSLRHRKSGFAKKRNTGTKIFIGSLLILLARLRSS